MVEKRATGGLVRLGEGSLNLADGCTFVLPKRTVPAEGVKLTMNFEVGFTADLTPAAIEAFRSLTAGAPVDPRVDKEWEAWRCPGCGRSHAEVKAGHAWQVDGAGNAACNGLATP